MKIWKSADREWIKKLARTINIPFCVAGGIDSLDKAYDILSAGAEKVSINSPALSNPNLIGELAAEFGSQCVVVGVDLRYENGSYSPFKFAGSEITSTNTSLDALDWVREVQERGAGEVVINSMDFDGTNDGYNTSLLARVRDDLSIPLVASGGAGYKEHFLSVFDVSEVDGALAAGIFHSKALSISDLKSYLKEQGVCVRY